MRVRRNVVLHRSVRNQSTRTDSIRFIVLHTTEGGTLDSTASWFDNPSSQASSHVVTDKHGQSARLVPDSAKAWTQAAWNSKCLSIEQVGFAATSRREWLTTYRPMLRETARWIAYWSRHHNIPIKRRGALGRGTGVVGHVDLGMSGGGHHDPGPGFPWHYVLAKARVYRALQRKR
jgi:N-acetyl-anhydromuramyl-L-alanine amidase AmpD